MTNKQISNKIWERVYAARRKHPVFAVDEKMALDVICREVQELKAAIADETLERQIDEALDVIATCVRFIAQEHKFQLFLSSEQEREYLESRGFSYDNGWQDNE